MGLPLFYILEENLDLERGCVKITGLDARHLTRSLRVKQGDAVKVSDCKGTIRTTRVQTIAQDSVVCRLDSSTYMSPERPQVVLFQAMARNTSMDEAVARAAEAGASRFVPFVSKRSPLEAIKKSGSRLDRWRTIARESSKVARRAYPLEVREPVHSFDESLLETVGACVVLWEDEVRKRFGEALPEEPPRSIGLVAGPEGGLSAAEVDVIRSMGARPASLGNLNMRAESAGSYATMIVRYHYGLLVPRESPPDE
jgi:16S rRNA (uracil1498-N3)-methyltransferase